MAPSSLFILVSSVCKSLQCLISTLTQGAKVVTYLGSLVQLCCGEGGALKANIAGMCEECLQCMDHTGIAPAHGACAFPVYTTQAPGCSEGETSKAGPGLHAFPRSKLFRFWLSATPQRQRLSWACILYPSQVRGAQATRYLARALSQVCIASYHLPVPSHLVSRMCHKSAVSGVLCVSSGGLILGCDPPGRCQAFRIPGRLG